MKIKLNVDAIEPSIESLVESELEKLQIIPCLGNMVLPVLKRIVEFEGNDFLLAKNSIPVDEIGINDVTSIIVESNEEYNTKYVFSKESVEKIQKYKRQRAKVYALKLKQCLNCNHQDLCYKLTTNYLKFISLEEKI